MNTLLFQDANISLGDAAIYSIIGFVVILLVLTTLALLIALLNFVANKIAGRKNKKTAPATTAVVDDTLAPGSCGTVKLFDVPDKEAAMIMAIVADELKTPLNELKFVSIKEKKEND